LPTRTEQIFGKFFTSVVWNLVSHTWGINRNWRYSRAASEDYIWT